MGNPFHRALGAALEDMREAMVADLNRPIVFDAMSGVTYEPPYGPPSPLVRTEAFDLFLQDGRLWANGAGWEAESGPITRAEALEIIQFLETHMPDP